MRTVILCVGKLREAFWRDAAAEYTKRLQRFGGVDIIECADKPEPKHASAADIARLIEAEGEALLQQIKPRDHVIALCIEGKSCTSPALAEKVRMLEDGGVERLIWVIGGSNGLSPAVIARAQEKLSFSPMTFPHQLARILLLEQLYRARKILAGENYHK
ncbi:MAG: 23S rRNA (pseudouridine(1915)-N(3))-methyltransferase RlmH [Oscillospiraceae bacterium]|jgi:23S rRNA (pseudouridine1915-N3)-methyltransferase|nr:23S rRNA (pseudouridine(1915)-N(3))-methyltransferase RlmH [Oscillospiraceae bacterium]